MSKVQLALTLVVGIVIGCLLPKKDFFCQDLAVYPADPDPAPCPVCEPLGPAPAPALAVDLEAPSMALTPAPVGPATLTLDDLVAHVQHLKEPLEQIQREVDTWLCFMVVCLFSWHRLLRSFVVSSPFFLQTQRWKT